MTAYKDAGEKDQINLPIPRYKLIIFLFASMSTARWLYHCCAQVAESSVLLCALGASTEEKLSLGDSHCLRFLSFFQV